MKTSVKNSNLSLATTALEDFWDFSKPIVFLGEWCRLYDRRHVWEPLNAPVLPYPWDSREDLKRAIGYTDEIYEQLLRILSDWLNHIHGTNNSLRYWRIVVGSFLHFYVQVLYDRYTCLQKARELYPNLTTIGISSTSYRTCNDTSEFISLCRNKDAWNLQLYTQVAEILEIEMKRHHYDWPSEVSKSTESTSPPKHALVKMFDFFLNRGLHSPVALSLTLIRRRILIRLLLASHLTAWPIISICTNPTRRSRRNEALRQGLMDLRIADAFGNLVLDTLAINMPFQYIEGFANVRNVMKPLSERRAPRAILTGLGSYWDTLFAVWAAECVERGTVLVGVQHGGTYGECVPTYGEKYERSVGDLFVSWGWDDGGRVVPLPAGRLIGISLLKRQRKSDEILWVSTADSRYTYFLSLLPIGPQIKNYYQLQERFYRAIDPAIRSKVILRLYPQDFRWSLRERWRDKFPELKISGGTSTLIERTQKTRLVVIDHFGATSFLEALAMNIPVVVFGDSEMFEIRESARSYYQGLHEVGVLHYSPEAAAATVNTIYQDIEAWWSEPQRQIAVHRFAYRYARTSSAAVKEWRDFINRLSRDALTRKTGKGVLET